MTKLNSNQTRDQIKEIIGLREVECCGSCQFFRAEQRNYQEKRTGTCGKWKANYRTGRGSSATKKNLGVPVMAICDLYTRKKKLSLDKLFEVCNGLLDFLDESDKTEFITGNLHAPEIAKLRLARQEGYKIISDIGEDVANQVIQDVDKVNEYVDKLIQVTDKLNAYSKEAAELRLKMEQIVSKLNA